jgi:predicted ATPase
MLLAGGGAAADAEAAYRRAIAIARAQQARMLELRAATSLARLARTQSHIADAPSLLNKIYSAFSEGFATPDLVAAQELMRDA